jgi:hypothetical protein
VVPLRTTAFGLYTIAALGCGGGGGGADAPSCLCDAPNGDGAPGNWADLAPIPAAIQETAAVALDGEVWVLGGFEGLGPQAKAQRYDVATNTWSAGPTLPAAMHHANVSVAGGTILVTGDMQTINFTPVGDVWALDPAIDTAWQVRDAMPRARGSAVTGVIDGTLYVAGGLAGGAVAFVDAYDPVADEWTERAAMPAARDHACGGVIDGILYVAGGRQGQPDAPLANTYAYDPGANAWTEVAPMPTGRGGTACGVIDGKLIVVGGEGNGDDPSGVFAQVESYDPATDAWTSHAAMPHPRHGMGAAVVGGTLYVPGGADVTIFAAVDTHDAFTP